MCSCIVHRPTQNKQSRQEQTHMVHVVSLRTGDNGELGTHEADESDEGSHVTHTTRCTEKTPLGFGGYTRVCSAISSACASAWHDCGVRLLLFAAVVSVNTALLVSSVAWYLLCNFCTARVNQQLALEILYTTQRQQQQQHYSVWSNILIYILFSL